MFEVITLLNCADLRMNSLLLLVKVNLLQLWLNMDLSRLLVSFSIFFPPSPFTTSLGNSHIFLSFIPESLLCLFILSAEMCFQ